VRRLLLALALTACTGAPPTAELRVHAAASLTGAFGEIAKEFEARHPGTKVLLELAGSQALRVRIEGGAPADVFAAADRDHMQAIAALVEAPVVFARNELVVVVPKGNPAGVRSLADLPGAARVVLAAPEVPAGRYARQALDAAGLRAAVEARVVSNELNVRHVLNRVAMGEADAGIVYRTDASAAADKVDAVAIAATPEAEYPIAVLKEAPQKEAARAFVDVVTGEAGRRILVAHGFGVPR
jgi:molybdate transport system substrate-binding protein